MTRAAARAIAAASAAIVVGGGGGGGAVQVAHADVPDRTAAAVSVDRDDSPGGRVELGFDSGAPVTSYGVSAQLQFLDHPIQIDRGGVVTYPVDHRGTLVIGGAIAAGDNVVLDARLPVSLQDGDRLASLGDSRALSSVGLGDLRLAARVRVAGDARRMVAARMALTLPTGRDNEFLGEARYTLAWQLVGRFTFDGGILLAATAGVRVRGSEVAIADRVAGDEATGAVGVVVPIPPFLGRLWCKPAQLGATAELAGALGDSVGGVRGPSPLEARVGFVGHPRPAWAIGVRAGFGLDDQLGAPAFRALAEVAYTP
jgi:hypothetical protein